MDLHWSRSGSGDVLIDVAIINTTAPSKRGSPALALQATYDRKHKAHRETAVQRNATFMAFVASTHGALQKEAEEIIGIIANSSVAYQEPFTRNQIIGNLKAKIAMAIVRGNARIMNAGFLHHSSYHHYHDEE